MADQPTIAIPLDIPDVRVLRTELTADQALIIIVHRASHRPRRLAGSDQGDAGHVVDHHPGATPSPDPDRVHRYVGCLRHGRARSAVSCHDRD